MMVFSWDFPSGPVVKTPCFQSRGCGFDPWLGNYKIKKSVSLTNVEPEWAS